MCFFFFFFFSKPSLGVLFASFYFGNQSRDRSIGGTHNASSSPFRHSRPRVRRTTDLFIIVLHSEIMLLFIAEYSQIIESFVWHLCEYTALSPRDKKKTTREIATDFCTDPGDNDSTYENKIRIWFFCQYFGILTFWFWILLWIIYFHMIKSL